MNRIYSCLLSVAVILTITVLPMSVFGDSKREIPDGSLQKAPEAYFNSANFQSGIQRSEGLSNLAKTHTPLGDKAVSYGFAAKSDEAKFFLIGTLYSEALAHLRDGKSVLAADRLKAIESQFVTLQAPNALYSYVSKTRNRIELGKYSTQALYDMLSFFQPFFEDYAKSLNQDKLILFRAGSWLVDMSLTAAAGNKQLIKQGKPQLEYFTKEMKRMDAPKGVLTALEKIDKIAGKAEIGDKDIERVLKQVKKIQTILG